MSIEENQGLTVVSLGLGKAGTNLHGKVWDNLEGFDVYRVGYDSDPRRRDAAREMGILVVDNLADITSALEGTPIHVIDNTTSSGAHAASTRAALDVLASAGRDANAWLLEKPVVTSEDQKVVMQQALAEIGPRAFVNENYLASRAVEKGRAIIEEQEAEGNDVTKILVHFVKDRVPNVVLDNRFTDTKGLAVYGIEMPHQLAIASALSGGELDTRLQAEGGSIVTNTFLHDIDGIEQSEGNITVFNQDGKTITLRQGLGPFDFDEANGLIWREYDWKKNEAERYAVVDFADGSSMRLSFDPLADAPRYHSRLELRSVDGSLASSETFPDNTLVNLIGAVATFAITNGGDRSPLLDQLNPEAAMRYYEQLSELRRTAGEPRSVPAIGAAHSSLVERYLATLSAEREQRQ